MTVVLYHLLCWNFHAIVRKIATFSNSWKLKSDILIHRFDHYAVRSPASGCYFPTHEIRMYFTSCPSITDISKSCELSKVRLFWSSSKMYAGTRLSGRSARCTLANSILAQDIPVNLHYIWLHIKVMSIEASSLLVDAAVCRVRMVRHYVRL